MRKHEQIPLYLIPIVVGMAGVLFAQQLADGALASVVLLFSVAIPVFAGGHFLARLHAQKQEKALLLTGTVFLILGAVITVSGLSESLVAREMVSMELARAARWSGLVGLLVGLFAVLVSVFHSGETAREFAGRFGLLARHMSDGFIFAGPDGTVLLANQPFYAMTGFDQNRVLGASLMGFDEFGFEEKNRHELERGGAVEREVSVATEGSTRYLEMACNPILDEHHHLNGILVVFRDITQQHKLAKRLERYTLGLQELVENQTVRLQQSEARLRDLLVHMNEGFLTLDSSFSIRFANTRAAQMLGAESDELVGQDLFAYVDVDEKPKLLSVLETAGVQQHAKKRQEIAFRPPGEGRAVPVMVSATLMDFEEGQRQRHSVVLTDLTELKRVQRELEVHARELETANEELRMHDRAKDAFLTNVTHELRTPISTIQGYMEMLAEGEMGEINESIKKATQVINRNIQRLLHRINEIIEFSRMEIRGLHLDIDLFSCRRVLNDCVASATPDALAKDVAIHTEIADEDMLAWGDQEKLAQVLTILLANAVKFTPEGGQITVSARAGADDSLALAVADSGIGIEKSQQQKVFAKFYQVDSALNRRYEGTGIGLSIAKTIVEAHGGSIELDSDVGRGSTFTLTIPSALFRVDAVAPTTATLNFERRVIVMTQTRAVAEALTQLLSQAGIDVVRAANGYECVRLAEGFEPGLFILDHGAEVLSGGSALQRVFEYCRSHTVPAVLLTQKQSGKNHDEGLRVDIPDFVPLLAKPFTAPQFFEACQEACSEETRLHPRRKTAREQRPPSLLLVSQDEDFCDWLLTATRLHRVVCHAVAGWDEALELAAHVEFDAALFDLDSAETDCEQRLERFRNTEWGRGVPVLATSMLNASRFLYSCEGFVEKPFHVGELLSHLDRIRANAQIGADT